MGTEQFRVGQYLKVGMSTSGFFGKPREHRTISCRIEAIWDGNVLDCAEGGRLARLIRVIFRIHPKKFLLTVH